MRRKIVFASTSLAAMTYAMMVSAQSSSEAYFYDPLGRLIRVVTTGGQNNGETQSICYDPAGNRTEYRATVSNGTLACTTVAYPSPSPVPSPTPSPTPSPSPTPTPTPTPTSTPAVSPSFNISSTDGYEGDDLVFTVTRTGSTDGAYTISFATSPGTASSNDFIAKSGTLSFVAGQLTATISVRAVEQTLIETNEDFYVNLSNASGGANITISQGVGMIFGSNCTQFEPC